MYAFLTITRHIQFEELSPLSVTQLSVQGKRVRRASAGYWLYPGSPEEQPVNEAARHTKAHGSPPHPVHRGGWVALAGRKYEVYILKNNIIILQEVFM